MLNDLTDSQENLIEDVASEWISNANGGNTQIDQIKASDCLAKIYSLSEMKAPKVLFFDGPMDAISFCKNELNQDIDTFDWFGVGYDSGWVSFYDYFQRIGVLERDDEGFNAVKDFMKSGAWATILFENLAICIARPNLVSVDDKGELHSDKGPAISFDDGYQEYAWHGTWVTEQIIMKPETLTKEEIIGDKNSEVSRAIAERLGWDGYVKRVETILIHKWFDEETKSHYELYDFKDRKGSLQPRLLKMESPELNDGTKPYYIEPVPPQAQTCQAARRWQCDPERPEIRECNENSALVFEAEA